MTLGCVSCVRCGLIMYFHLHLHLSLALSPYNLQALDERRLSLMLDQKGIITKVGGSSKELFGFDPQMMAGRSIADFVDVFQPDSGEGGI